MIVLFNIPCSFYYFYKKLAELKKVFIAALHSFHLREILQKVPKVGTLYTLCSPDTLFSIWNSCNIPKCLIKSYFVVSPSIYNLLIQPHKRTMIIHIWNVTLWGNLISNNIFFFLHEKTCTCFFRLNVKLKIEIGQNFLVANLHHDFMIWSTCLFAYENFRQLCPQ